MVANNTRHCDIHRNVMEGWPICFIRWSESLCTFLILPQSEKENSVAINVCNNFCIRYKVWVVFCVATGVCKTHNQREMLTLISLFGFNSQRQGLPNRPCPLFGAFMVETLFLGTWRALKPERQKVSERWLLRDNLPAGKQFKTEFCQLENLDLQINDCKLCTLVGWSISMSSDVSTIQFVVFCYSGPGQRIHSLLRDTAHSLQQSLVIPL